MESSNKSYAIKDDPGTQQSKMDEVMRTKLHLLASYIREKDGSRLSYREIMQECRFGSQATAMHYLSKLKDQGIIEFDEQAMGARVYTYTGIDAKSKKPGVYVPERFESELKTAARKERSDKAKQKRLQILEFFKNNDGISASLQEIADKLDMNMQTIHNYTNLLQSEGHLTKTKNKGQPTIWFYHAVPVPFAARTLTTKKSLRYAFSESFKNGEVKIVKKPASQSANVRYNSGPKESKHYKKFADLYHLYDGKAMYINELAEILGIPQGSINYVIQGQVQRNLLKVENLNSGRTILYWLGERARDLPKSETNDGYDADYPEDVKGYTGEQPISVLPPAITSHVKGKLAEGFKTEAAKTSPLGSAAVSSSEIVPAQDPVDDSQYKTVPAHITDAQKEFMNSLRLLLIANPGLSAQEVYEKIGTEFNRTANQVRKSLSDSSMTYYEDGWHWYKKKDAPQQKAARSQRAEKKPIVQVTGLQPPRLSKPEYYTHLCLLMLATAGVGYALRGTQGALISAGGIITLYSLFWMAKKSKQI